jgi:hypothetical protein
LLHRGAALFHQRHGLLPAFLVHASPRRRRRVKPAALSSENRGEGPESMVYNNDSASGGDSVTHSGKLSAVRHQPSARFFPALSAIQN